MYKFRPTLSQFIHRSGGESGGYLPHHEEVLQNGGWRLHTRLCNFVRNISTNISALGQRTHLKLGELYSLFIVYIFILFFAWQCTHSINLNFTTFLTKNKTVFLVSLHFEISLHFVLRLQSAFCILYWPVLTQTLIKSNSCNTTPPFAAKRESCFRSLCN